MEDDKLKDLFRNFNPDLSSDLGFMSRLKQNLDAVEIVKNRNAELHRRSKRAIAVAAFAGFIAGVVTTILHPYIMATLGDIHFTLSLPAIQTITISYSLLGWIATAIISTAIAINTYDIAVSR